MLNFIALLLQIFRCRLEFSQILSFLSCARPLKKLIRVSHTVMQPTIDQLMRALVPDTIFFQLE